MMRRIVACAFLFFISGVATAQNIDELVPLSTIEFQGESYKVYVGMNSTTVAQRQNGYPQQHTLDIKVNQAALRLTIQDHGGSENLGAQVLSSPDGGDLIPCYSGTLDDLENGGSNGIIDKNCAQASVFEFTDHLVTTKNQHYLFFNLQGLPLMFSYGLVSRQEGLDDVRWSTVTVHYTRPFELLLPDRRLQFSDFKLEATQRTTKADQVEQYRQELETELFGAMTADDATNSAYDSMHNGYVTTFNKEMFPVRSVRVAMYNPGARVDSALTVGIGKVSLQFFSDNMALNKPLRMKVWLYDRRVRRSTEVNLTLSAFIEQVKAYQARPQGTSWAEHFSSAEQLDTKDQHALFVKVDGVPLLFLYDRQPYQLLLPQLRCTIVNYQVNGCVSDASVNPQLAFHALR